MAIHSTYSKVRANLAELLDRIEAGRETVVINRRGHSDAVIISADELSSILETLHLLRSPKNANRLLTAIERVQSGRLKPETPEALRKALELDPEA